MKCTNCGSHLNAERPGKVFEADTLTHGRTTVTLHDDCRREWFTDHPPTMWIVREKVTSA